MKKVTIDFTGCKNIYEIHSRMNEKLDFPDFYGENLDALWDVLTGFIEWDQIIYLKGCTDVTEQLVPYMEKIIMIFRRAEEMYGDIEVHVVDSDFSI